MGSDVTITMRADLSANSSEYSASPDLSVPSDRLQSGGMAVIAAKGYGHKTAMHTSSEVFDDGFNDYSQLSPSVQVTGIPNLLAQPGAQQWPRGGHCEVSRAADGVADIAQRAALPGDVKTGGPYRKE